MVEPLIEIPAVDLGLLTPISPRAQDLEELKLVLSLRGCFQVLLFSKLTLKTANPLFYS